MLGYFSCYEAAAFAPGFESRNVICGLKITGSGDFVDYFASSVCCVVVPLPTKNYYDDFVANGASKLSHKNAELSYLDYSILLVYTATAPF